MDLDGLLATMTLEEKARLCAGADWASTAEVARLAVPPVLMSDGPYGLRVLDEGSEYLNGEYQAKRSTCFPTEVSLASSWDVEVLRAVGGLLGQECRTEGVALLMGPGVNIKRSPLCGRSFEYLSEDPYLAGTLAAAYVDGLQATGVGACLKHFAANNQETRRMSADSQVDERTLREIYLPSFEIPVTTAAPATLMCAYNRLNGEYCCENHWLLTTVLRDDWGFEGFVMTDWGAMDERVPALEAGLDVEMPYSGPESTAAIIEAVEDGRLDLAVVDRAVRRVLTIVDQVVPRGQAGHFDIDQHHAAARQLAADCLVLLKNSDDLLPLTPDTSLAVIGQFATSMRCEGGGSAYVRPTCLDVMVEELHQAGFEAEYAPGYDLTSDAVNQALIDDAVAVAGRHAVAIVVAGLPESYETECYDRTDLRIPESHRLLIEAVCQANPNTVVVLCNGAPVEMPWHQAPKAILEAYLAGQAAAGAVVDVVTGRVNPSGRLAETFPIRLEDSPAYLHFGAEEDRVSYGEGIFVGYRYYDSRAMAVRYPFGHGLSYTTFEYGELELSDAAIGDADSLTVRLSVRNSGGRPGKEVVQLYVHRDIGAVPRPEQELKGFAKVALDPGQATVVEFTLAKRSFAHWDLDLGDWRIEDGRFDIRVGASSRDIRQTASVMVQSAAVRVPPVTLNTTVADVARHPGRARLLDEMLQTYVPDFLARYTSSEPSRDETGTARRHKMFEYMPLRVVNLFSEGALSLPVLRQYIGRMNALDPGEE